jgi:hypothetical protein
VIQPRPGGPGRYPFPLTMESTVLNFVFLLSLNGVFWVEDYNLTGADCLNAVADYVEQNPEMARGVPSCEVAPIVEH